MKTADFVDFTDWREKVAVHLYRRDESIHQLPNWVIGVSFESVTLPGHWMGTKSLGDDIGRHGRDTLPDALPRVRY
jgi:hypothetical protein